MSIVRAMAAVAVVAAVGGGFAAPVHAYHICVTAPDAPDVCICTRPTDHNCGHGSEEH